MTENGERYRIHSHLTRTRWLHVEDALEIGKVRLFAGEYRRGEGAKVTAYHYLDLADARVLLADLAWGKAVDFTEYKGTDNGEGPRSRVLKSSATVTRCGCGWRTGRARRSERARSSPLAIPRPWSTSP